MKMNARQRAIGSKGAAIEAALKTIAKCDPAQLPDYLRQYGEECADRDSPLFGLQTRFVYEALARQAGTPIAFDVKLAKWIRSAFSKDDERRYLQMAHVERAKDGTLYVLGVDGIALHAVVVTGDDFAPGHLLRIDAKGNVFSIDYFAVWPVLMGYVYERASKPTTARGKKTAKERLVTPKPYDFTSILPKSGLKPATLRPGAPLLIDDKSGVKMISFEIEQSESSVQLDAVKLGDLAMNVALHQRVTKLPADWKTFAQTPTRPLLYAGHYGLWVVVAVAMPLSIPK